LSSTLSSCCVAFEGAVVAFPLSADGELEFRSAALLLWRSVDGVLEDIAVYESTELHEGQAISGLWGWRWGTGRTAVWLFSSSTGLKEHREDFRFVSQGFRVSCFFKIVRVEGEQEEGRRCAYVEGFTVKPTAELGGPPRSCVGVCIPHLRCFLTARERLRTHFSGWNS